MIIQNTESLEMLVMVSRLLSSKLDTSELLVTIMRLSSRVVGAERASLYLLDEEKKELYFDIALDLPEDLQKMRFKLGEGIAGTCALEEKSIISNDVQNDSRHTDKVDNESGFMTRSLLTCPMIIKGKVIGVVQAINKIDGEFTLNDKNNFEAFSSQAAIAIENSRLFNKVKEEKKKLDIIFKKISEGAILTDKNGEIIILNNSAALYLEYEKFDFKNIKKIFNNFSSQINLEEFINSSLISQKFILERENPKKLFLEIVVLKIKKENTENIDSLLWIISDITQQKLEEKMARNFLSLISHKFKTPLATINGFAQILSETPKKNTEMIEKASKSIYSQGKKLAELIDMLLDFTTVENLEKTSLNLEEVEVSQLFEEIKKDCNNEDFSLKTVVIENFSINIDKILFKKAIKELIKNGLKFNKSDKKIIILSAMTKENKKMFTIGDNGVGIPGEEFSKIFIKFYQIESSFTGQVDGWGLGLSLVDKIVKLHNGKIFVKSQLDKGSAFTIVL